MSRTAIDTSVIVAALLSWHDHHEAAFRALERALEAEESLILPMPALVEAYAVLTRLPAPHRLSPEDALQLLHASLHEIADLVGLAEQDAWPFITGLAGQQIAGRATYDSQIIACAIKAGAERIFSLNERDFERLKPAGVRIINPLSES